MKRMSNSGGISLPSAAYGVGVGGGGGGEKSADMGPCGLCRRKRRDWPSLKYMLRKGEQQEEMLYIYM